MVSKESYTITLKNNTTEKEGMQYLLETDRRFINPDLNSKKAILKALDLPTQYSKTFDLIFIQNPPTTEEIEISIDQITLIELKTTKKKLESNPHGFFFGATENEFDLARKLGDKFRFCFVCLHPDCKSFKLLSLDELEKLMKNKRTQYQINLIRNQVLKASASIPEVH